MKATLLELTDSPSKPDHRKLFPLIVAVLVMTITATFFSGSLLQRWGDPEVLTDQVAALGELSDQLGNWHYVEEGTPLPEGLQAQLELRGHVHRVYEHVSSGQRVTLLLLVGPAGPLVRHPPEICYGNRANELQETRDIQFETEQGSERLRLLAYTGDSLAADDFLVAYGFGSQGTWDCPQSPRMAYGGMPVLIKLQVLTDQFVDSSESGLVEFLQQLLPRLNALTVNS